MTTTTRPAGYTYDDPSLSPSPVAMSELELLKQSVLFGEEDAAALAPAGDVSRSGRTAPTTSTPPRSSRCVA